MGLRSNILRLSACLLLLVGAPARACEGGFARGLAIGQILPLGVDGGFVAAQEVQALQSLGSAYPLDAEHGTALQVFGLVGGAVARLWTSTTTDDFTLEPYYEQRLWQLGVAGGVEQRLGSFAVVARGRAILQPGSSSVGNAQQLHGAVAVPICLPVGSLGLLVPSIQVEQSRTDESTQTSLATELSSLASWRQARGVSGLQLRLSYVPALSEDAEHAARLRMEAFHLQRRDGKWLQLRTGYEAGRSWQTEKLASYQQLRVEPRAGVSFVSFLSAGLALPLSSTWALAPDGLSSTTLEATALSWLRLVPQRGWEVVLTLSTGGLKATQKTDEGNADSSLYIQRTDSLWQLSLGGAF
ncbi:MAG: hypothetical protein ACKO6N_17860 [Myxococcota bacterium]